MWHPRRCWRLNLWPPRRRFFSEYQSFFSACEGLRRISRANDRNCSFDEEPEVISDDKRLSLNDDRVPRFSRLMIWSQRFSNRLMFHPSRQRLGGMATVRIVF